MIKFTEQTAQIGGFANVSNGLADRVGALFRRIGRAPLFLVMVVMPTAVAVIYYLLFAAPMYISEARFVVRSPSQQTPNTFDSVLMGVGLGSATSSDTDAYVVHEYITSREAVRDLEKNQNLRALLARPRLDVVSRFPRPLEGTSFESLYEGYNRFVTVGYNSQTGISTLRVKAFTPVDAQTIATALLDGGERVINRLNQRSEVDALNDATGHVADAEARVTSAEAALTEFRNHEKLIDPTRSSLAGLELVAKLEGQLDTLRAERAALAASAPESPQLSVMDHQITALQDQADGEKDKIAGEDSSLAPMIGKYERLTIDRDFAAKELAAASSAVETARLDMRRKHLYLERIVPPDLPDASRSPHRLYSIGMVLLTALLIYGIVILVLAGFREHHQQ